MSTENFIKAIKEGDLKTVEKMLADEPGLVQARDENGVSPVLIATYYGQTSVAQLLAANSPGLDVFEAAAVGQLEALRSALSGDPKLANAFNVDGFQPLGLASFFGQPEAAAVLIEHGAEVNSASRNGASVAPLHSAAAGKHLEIARMLLDHGADANLRQAGGFTPLHSAAQNGDLTMLHLLLERGADPRLANEEGVTPRELAAEEGHRAIVIILDSMH